MNLTRLSSYFAAQPDVLLAYFFGSQVSGRAAPESDCDIAVLTPLPMTYVRRFEMASEVCRLLDGAIVDLIPLNHAPLELAYAVIATGRELFERDITTRVEFEAAVLSRYSDVIPVLREQRADLIRGGNHEAGVRRNRAALRQAERVFAEIRAVART